MGFAAIRVKVCFLGGWIADAVGLPAKEATDSSSAAQSVVIELVIWMS
jgi:hypothetical protein